MGLEAGVRVFDAFYCEDYLRGSVPEAMLGRLERAGAEMIPVAPHVFDRLSSRRSGSGIVATFATFEATVNELTLTGDELVIVLDRLQKPHNVGMLIRTADAAGAGAVVLLDPCADPFDPAAVRAGMGSQFNVPIVWASDVGLLFHELRDRGLRTVAADPHVGAPWGAGLWEGGVALVLGCEPKGLAEDVRTHADGFARLPIIGKADSLNVSVAGGALMYAWLRAGHADGARSEPDTRTPPEDT